MNVLGAPAAMANNPPAAAAANIPLQYLLPNAFNGFQPNRGVYLKQAGGIISERRERRVHKEPFYTESIFLPQKIGETRKKYLHNKF